MPVYTVSQVNQYIKDLLDGDGALGGIYIRGELSNYKTYPSGHHYFSMKDAGGAIRCVMFRREAAGLRFQPENGMKVIAFGRVTVFPRDGQYQLYVSQLTPDGVGELYVAFEQLKARLSAEGLFDPAHKKPLPAFPERIALVTSPAGAAVRDMLRILGARWPMAEVAVVPVRVQGAEAPGEIAAALDWVNRARAADLIITGRGGGSMEDLRAATPSNAAELAVPDQSEVAAVLRQSRARMGQAFSRRVSEARRTLERCQNSRALQSPMNYVEDRRVLLDYQRTRLARGLSDSLNREQQRLGRLAAALDAMSPLKVLGRGYAIARKADGTVLTSVKDAVPGDALSLRLADGEVPCVIAEKP